MPTFKGIWDPSACPQTCKEFHGSGHDASVLAYVADDLKRGVRKHVDVVIRSDCGGVRGFSLTCDCDAFNHDELRGTKSDPRASGIVVCLGGPGGTCASIAMLEHEFVHVRQYDNGDPTNEYDAYKKSCEIQLKQQCKHCNMSEQQLERYLDSCARREMSKSLGPRNLATIQKGCENLCKEYYHNDGMKDPLVPEE